MRHTRLTALACTAIAVTGLVRQMAAPTYKPVVHQRLLVEAAGRPASFTDLWRLSSAIVEGVVEKTEPVATAPRTRSRVTVRIVEVFKGGGQVRRRGEEIQVHMAGAVTDYGSFVERLEDPDVPLLRRNQRPILFLVDGTDHAFDLATGTHDSIYLVDGASIASNGRSELARQLAEQSHGQFAASLRARHRMEAR